MRFAAILVSLSLFLFFFSGPVHAQAIDIGQSRITPASPLYFLKAVKEDLQLRLAGTTQTKLLLHLQFATTRLREVKTLLSQNQDLIQATLERYMAELNRLPDKHQDKDEVGIKIKDVVNTHLLVLEQIYPLSSDPKAKMAIRSVLNRIIQRADIAPVAKLPVCTLLAREASSSALNQTEKFVLTERARSCQQAAKISP